MNKIRYVWKLFLFLVSVALHGQPTMEKPHHSFTTSAGILFFTNRSVDQISEKLQTSHRFDTLRNAFVTIGTRWSIDYPKFEIENGLLVFNSFSSENPQNRMIFQIKGLQYQFLYKQNLWNTKYFRSNAHLGFGYSFITFKAIDKALTNISLDTLLIRPSASPALDFTPKGNISNVYLGADIEWKTHLFQSFLNDLNIGLRTQYTQPLFNKKEVVFNGTNITVPNFPSMSYNHIRFEMFFRLTLKENEKRKSKPAEKQK
jgi:hypothetical protein